MNRILQLRNNIIDLERVVGIQAHLISDEENSGISCVNWYSVYFEGCSAQYTVEGDYDTISKEFVILREVYMRYKELNTVGTAA